MKNSAFLERKGREQELPNLTSMMPGNIAAVWASLGSTVASFMFFWAVFRQFIPEAYTAVEAYLSTNSSKNAKRLKAEIAKDCSSLVLSMDEHERVTDEFRGAKVWEIMTDNYLEHVVKEGKEIGVRNRQRKLYTNCSNHRWPSHNQPMWSHVAFEHPATFETIALEPEKKQDIIDDLLTFSKSKDYYARIGKVWKRGYLLYGPPGTGKSTMIAAMANLLSYDVYDLELTAVKDNTELRKLLIETTNKSIIVIEDIDCSLDLTGQRKKKEEKSSESQEDEKVKEISRKDNREESSKVTLSGLLNFIDGLWSACGGRG
ncbi:AAA-ATPase ASD, mitochondrial [Vitis vinifera]|uniref:AAA-ATPase ASD, mitochondrial n=1 Tax=Vitis vinifera TaxID=29760 RepID=A0A438DJE2_VITVI|nr:AAA-ATPase ASD, mitochondrial [Vitis vinifera]